jgi:NADH:ubiquinone oxidoreductase subunit 5 (subunit L)/multisubunit Na+/H+ antiporter MnhA subunit
MFFCLIWLAAWLFRKSEDERKKPLPRDERPIEKRFRDDLCLIAGAIMSAALAWIGVAFVADEEFVTKSFLKSLFVHGPAGPWMALGLIITSVLISFGLFRRSLRQESIEPKRRLQHELVAIPIVIIALLAGGIGCVLAFNWLSGVTGGVEPTPPSGQRLDTLIMLIPEVLAIWAFAISWIVKSQHPRVSPWVDRFRRWLARLGWRYELPR